MSAQEGQAGLAALQSPPPLAGRPSVDNVLSKVLRNFGTVMSGQVVMTVMSFAALTMNSRALGVAGLGLLFLIQATCELTSKVLAFQNWQTMIKFGADAVRARDGARLRAAWRMGFYLDTLAAVAAAAVSAGLFLAAPALIGLELKDGQLGLIYAASLLLSGSGVSIGALRLLDSFGLVVGISVAGAALLFVNAAVLWATGAPLWVYLISIPAIGAAVSVTLIIVGYLRIERAARAFEADGAASAPLDRRGYFRFALGVSATGTLNAMRQRAEVLLVGAILGPSGAAFYGVAYRMAALMDRVAESGRQSAYPVIGQLVADGAFPKAAALAFRLSKMGLMVCIPAMIVFVVFGGDILRLCFGQEFAAAKPNLILLAAGSAIYLITFPLGPLIQISMGSGRFLLLTAISSVGFLVFGVLGPWLFGQAGAGAGAAAFGMVLAGLSVGQVLLRLRSTPDQEEAASSRQAA